MEKITFVNGTKPALNAANLNKMQNNIEKAINEILESGSNTNGKYMKFKDGTLICWKRVTKDVELTKSWGALYENNTGFSLGSFAYTFIEPPIVNINVIRINGSEPAAFIERFTPTTTGVEDCLITRPISTAMAAYTFDIQAIGRWY